jgi:hypothetical protein
MPMNMFRRDAAAGLRKAEASLATTVAKIDELEQQRRTALLESDEVAAVHAIDLQIAGQRAAAATHADRVQVLKAALKEQQAEQLEQQRQAALTEVQKRLDGQVELAREVEAAVKQLGDRWEKLLQWRQAILGAWPDGLPRPLASDFENVGPLRRELGHALHAAGRPAWDRQCSIPPPVPVPGVQGLEAKGLAGAVAAAGAAFIARIRSQRIDSGVDDENTTEAA